MKIIKARIALALETARKLLKNSNSNIDASEVDLEDKEKTKHYVVLSQFYKPEPFIFAPAIAEMLFQAGNDVSVVTGFPNRPGGKLFQGYKQKFGFSETINGVKVHRVPLVINHSQRAVERIVNFLTFSVSALTASSKIRSTDAVYVYATPATAAIPAQIWKKLFGIPYVLHVQDLWPESVTDSGMMKGGKIIRLVEFILHSWLKTLYAGASKIIAISPGMKDLLIARGVDSQKIEVIFNWADESTITPKSADSFSGQSTTLLYAGNLGPMQDLVTVIEAAGQLNSAAGFSLKIAGGGVLEHQLQDLAKEKTSIEFLGRLPRVEVGELYMQSDFQIVPLKDIPIFRVTVPSKLQASLAAGVPVITTVKGDVANLINQYNAGIVAEPEDVSSLVSAFQRAHQMSMEDRAEMGKNALKLYEELMSKASGTHAIKFIMEAVSNLNR